MKIGYRIGLAGLIALCSSLSVVTLASAQPRDHKDERRDIPRDEHLDHRPLPPPGAPPVVPPPPGPRVVAPPPPDPRLAAARLQALEDQREREREAKVRDERAWEASREERAALHRRQVAEQWGAVAARADAQAELQTHADRMAHLNRILDIARLDNDEALANHCRLVIQREIARSARVMARISAEGGVR